MHDQPDDRCPGDEFDESVGICFRSDSPPSHRLREARRHGGEHYVFEPPHDEFVELRVGTDLGDDAWQSGRATGSRTSIREPSIIARMSAADPRIRSEGC